MYSTSYSFNASPPWSPLVPPNKVIIDRTSSNILCMLVKVTHADPSNTGTVSISNDSPGADYLLTPIARSYNRRRWEVTQGPLLNQVKVKKCTKQRCTIRMNRSGDYFLMSFSHSLPTFKERLSRFFMQSTFGPTSDMINNWSYSQNIKGMANWIKNQIDQVPATKHRVYLRSHADHMSYNNTIGDRNIAIQSPCDENSRWRKYAFTFADVNQPFEVVADGNQFVIKRNGVVRTVVDDFRSEDGVYSGAGNYLFCWLIEDRIGGTMYIRPTGNGDCKTLEGGNPRFTLTTSAINNHGQLLQFIDLPTQSSFEYVKPMQNPNDGNFWLIMEMWSLNQQGGLYSTVPDQCNAFNNTYQFVVGEFPDGEMMLSTSLAVPLKNTIEEPLSDGCSSAVQDGARLCCNAAKNFLNMESCVLSSGQACQSSAYARSEWDWGPKLKDNVVLCGSEGEVATDDGIIDPTRPKFSMFGHEHNLVSGGLNLQRQAVPYTIFLTADDQLRQRMAFALSQILVVSPIQVDSDTRETEIYFNYYDIFVRHAFGSYRDILREVSYSPMMAEMLSYLGSRSASYVLEDEGRVSRPDENFAREIMQLFSIGLFQLKMDGSTMMQNGEELQTYDNTDIQTFARAWTGFRRHNLRFNKDGWFWTSNRMDIMALEGRWRDPFPKLGLDETFIGDGYPICSELPQHHFLRKGAEYRLVGSQDRSELEFEHPWFNYDDVKRYTLDPSSNLYQVLCNASQNGGPCDYQTVVTLDQNLDCFGNECEIDNWTVIHVADGVKYEYVRPACVKYSFHNSQELNKVVDRHNRAMCAPKTVDDIAFGACCVSDNPAHWLSTNADYFCEFSFERSSYASARSRCQNEVLDNFPNPDTCDWTGLRIYANNENQREGCFQYMHESYKSWHWTNATCAITAKVNSDGFISIVHEPNLDINADIAAADPTDTLQSVYMTVNPYNTNYFKVKWDGTGEFPNVDNQCANNACTAFGNSCLCEIEVTEVPVFDAMPTKESIINSLRVGHAPPDSFDDATFTLQSSDNGVHFYTRNGGYGNYSKYSVFGVEYRGQWKYFKNVESMVTVAGNTGGVTYQFRNPPSFLNIAKPDTRDAIYETEEVLNHYFHHPNVAPFLGKLLIKRFGISNPSPRFVEVVANAFNSGTYVRSNVSFGDGNYGNLEATLAAILLDDESRQVILDADPTSGSLREPLLKVMAYLRAMEYGRTENVTSLMMGNLQDFIGQQIHATPSVFSFFLPDFSPPGKLSDTSLTSPEAQVLDAPKIIGMMNGFFSLVDIGMSNCFGGFGDRNSWWCDGYLSQSTQQMRSKGYLNFLPQSWRFGTDVVDELSVLLTAGRLNSISKTLLVDMYDNELYANGGLAALKVVQKLIVATPEFHTTNVFKSLDTPRPETPQPQPSNIPYKSIVFLNLDGGLDSYNVLVPHSNCNVGTAQYTMFDEYTKVRGDIALDINTLHTIDTSSSGQVCDTFGLHESLPFLKTLFDDEDLTFFANIGVLQQPTTKLNWSQNHRETALFSHNTQQEEINFVDIYEAEAGTGVCGRMLDILGMNGFKPGSISVNGIASSLRSQSSPTFVVDPNGFAQVNPVARVGVTTDITDKLKLVNTAASVTSSFYGETWSDSLLKALDENDLMYEEFTNAYVNASFPDTDLGRQLRTVAMAMKTRDTRGTDRDVFNVRIGSFDHHVQIAEPLRERLSTINDALEAFVVEMRDYQGLWDDTVVVVVSEFARTLMGNTGNGSDHAWGGNYFAASGSLAGGKIMGTFPNNLTNDGPYAFEPGILIPSTPLESLWNGIAEWFGITSSDDLNTVLPNRGTFSNLLWSQSDLFSTNR